MKPTTQKAHDQKMIELESYQVLKSHGALDAIDNILTAAGTYRVKNTEYISGRNMFENGVPVHEIASRIIGMRS